MRLSLDKGVVVMKTKKIFLILAPAFLLAVLITIAVAVSSNSDMTTDKDPSEEVQIASVLEENSSTSKGDMKTHDVLGKTYWLMFDSIETTPTGLEWQLYKDDNGNEFRYDEYGNFIGMKYDTSYFEDGLPDPQEFTDDTFMDEEAIASAVALGREQFGERIDALTFRDVFQSSLGSKTVRYWQLLGEDDFVIGVTFFATYLGDGRLFGFGMPYYGDLESFDESLLQGVTRDSVMAYLDARTKELHGDRLIDWELTGDKVSLQRDKDGFFLEASVMANVHFDSEDMDDGGHTYRIRLPFEG